MKKLIGFVFALLLLGVGFMGIYHFYNLEKAKTIFDEAIKNYRNEKIKEALKGLETLIENYNYPVVDGHALLVEGDIYYSTGNIKKAIECYDRVITDKKLMKIKRVYYQANIRIARIYRIFLKNKKIDRNSNLLKKEILELERLLREDVEPSGYNQLTLKGILSRLESIAFKPEFELPDVNESIDQLKTELGYLHFYSGNLKAADDYFKNSKNPYAKLGLARVYLAKGKREEALKLLYDIKDFDPTGKPGELYYDELFRYANELYKKSFYEEAIFYFKKISSKVPDSVYSELSLYTLAKYYYDRKDYKRALGYISTLLSNSTNFKDQDGLILKGIIMYKTKNFRTALNTFSNILKKYPSSPRKYEVKEWKELCERAIKYLN